VARPQNDPISLLIERPVAGGDMLARHDGRIVFIRGVIPGERVRARIVRQAKGVAWADLLEVEDASPDRRPVDFDPTCGGGHYAHIAPARQAALKGEIIADAFRRLAKHPLEAPPAVAPSPERGYRVRARLHVRNGRVGFFREQSHVLCDAAPSGQLREDAIVAAQDLVSALGARAADCDAVIIAENVAATDRVLHLEPRAGARFETADASAWAGTGATGLTTSTEGGARHLRGIGVVTDSAYDLFGGLPPIDLGWTWTRHATSFFQGNRFLAGALVSAVLKGLGPAATGTVADCYSGVGLFSVAAAGSGAHVLAIEGDPSSSADLAVNAKQLGDRIRAVSASVETALSTPPPSGLSAVIVDPPRTGMSPEAVRGLIGWQSPRIVYVSCDPPTLARDTRLLLEAGYRVSSVEAFDLFPNTPHVETVAVLDR
jgi:23S rRNA (uracil1939-C5)-methyltransferase